MKDLLTRALDAHGGLSRWREIEAFQLKVSISGGLWRLKGLPSPVQSTDLVTRQLSRWQQMERCNEAILSEFHRPPGILLQ
jgi:hypothetical protein